MTIRSTSKPESASTETLISMEIESLRAVLGRGDYAAVCTQADSLLDGLPSSSTLVQENAQRDILYMKAVAERYLIRHDAALETLNRLQSLAPNYGRAWQEAGHNHLAMCREPEALSAYQRAVNLNPALLASWRALVPLLVKMQLQDAADHARYEIDRLNAAPKELVSVQSMISEGLLFRAEQLCRAFLKSHPQHIEAMRLLADLGVRNQVLDDAEFLLESALEFAPESTHARYDYALVLHKRQKFEQALEQARILCGKQPNQPAFETLFANESMAVGDFDTALGVYDHLLTETPDNPNTHLVKGHALKAIGKHQGAVDCYRRAFGLREDFGDAMWSLANLKTYRFTDDEISRMRDAESDRGIAIVDRYHLCFALGKAHEDRQQFDEAFAFYERGNRLKKQECRYDADRMAQEFSDQVQFCTRDLLEKSSGWGCPVKDPIFIVGLPRAGSTLLEQILASHSLVDGTLELPNILALAHRLNGRKRLDEKSRYPEILHQLTPRQCRDFGSQYIQDTRIHRLSAPNFTDKMPNNFRHIGLIHMILPNARIIDARRHPMACCFSGFKQLFAEGQEFSYGLEEIGRYYKGYVDLMDHWDRVLPGKVLRVQYEDVVANFDHEVHRILDFCDLPFEQACLQFHRTERPVRTASSEQVREPLYQSAVAQWKNFEHHLQPLRDALGPLC